MDICERCLDRYEIQDAYEARLPEIASFIDKQDYENALAVLDQLQIAEGARDHEGWLQNSILADRALILGRQGRWNEALDIYRLRAKRGFQDDSEYLVHQLAVADLLDQADKPAAAVQELELGLNAAQGNSISTALNLFVLYAGIAAREGWDIPTSYRPLLEQTLQRWGITIDQALLDQASLVAAIDAAHDANRAAQARYERLHQQLLELGDDVEAARSRAALLREYIEQEPIALYQRMAANLSDQLLRK
jgi:hypothetical protein